MNSKLFVTCSKGPGKEAYPLYHMRCTQYAKG